jgi:hypothetical protein
MLVLQWRKEPMSQGLWGASESSSSKGVASSQRLQKGNPAEILACTRCWLTPSGTCMGLLSYMLYFQILFSDLHGSNKTINRHFHFLSFLIVNLLLLKWRFLTYALFPHLLHFPSRSLSHSYSISFQLEYQSVLFNMWYVIFSLP